MSLGPDQLDEIIVFENFLHRIGFKRNEGAIYGLLVLSEKPLTSEKIESTLNLSQSAVSQALKRLQHFGAIETRESRNSKSKLHTAKVDSLTTVATIFRKREQETIEEFKKMALRLRNDSPSSVEESIVQKRLASIINTCELAESVMNFVIKMAGSKQLQKLDNKTQILPEMINALTENGPSIGHLAANVTDHLTKRGGALFQSTWKSGISKLTQTQTGGKNE